MTDTDIELVYFPSCPNLEAARASLRAAMADLGRAPLWKEWNVDEPSAPERVRGYPSPSVLVGGEHVLGERPGEPGLAACSAAGASPAAAIVGAVRRHA